MPIVELDTNEWQQVMAIISTAPWRDANPLLMKIGGQLRAHQSNIQQGVPPQNGDGASKEVGHE